MAEPKKQNYLHGAAILAAGVVIMKILGFIYKVPLGNILGDEGYTHFLVAYNIYSVFLTVATAGLPVALSRMISEANTMNRPNQVKRIFSVAWLTFCVLGVVCTLIMFLFPTELADALNDVEASQSILALSPAVLLVCLTSAYRGYCQGHENMKPTTVGQVLEVLVKVVIGLVLAWYLKDLGKSLPLVSAGAIFGVTAGSLAALVYMFAYKRRNYAALPGGGDEPESRGQILSTLLKVGIPITLGSSVLSLINLVDSGLCMGRLQDAAGFSYADAKVLYGVYGKAQTLYNLPAAFITPLTISVVPAIAACRVTHRGRESSRIAENSLRIATVICLPMGVGLSVLAEPIMTIIYPGSHESGPADADGRGLLLRLHGAHDERRPPGGREREIPHLLHDNRRRREDRRQLVPGGGPWHQHPRRAHRHPQLLRRNVRHGLHLPLPGHVRPTAAGKHPGSPQPGRSMALPCASSAAATRAGS